jgi:hypothetical protein
MTMGNTNQKKKRETLYQMVVHRLRHGELLHIRDLTFYVENNTRYNITPLGLGQILRPHVKAGRLERYRPKGQADFLYGMGDSLK